MILYRALSEYDLKYINDGKEVMSTLCYEDERIEKNSMILIEFLGIAFPD